MTIIEFQDRSRGCYCCYIVYIKYT